MSYEEKDALEKAVQALERSWGKKPGVLKRLKHPFTDLVKEAATAVIGTRPKLFIPPKTREKMALIGLSERDIQDVFRRGEMGASKDGSRYFVKEYYKDVVGFYFTRSKRSGDYVVIGAWKRPRG